MNSSSVKQFLSLGALTIIIILLLPYLARFLDYTASVLAYPFAWALTENENLLYIHGILSGQNFYRVNDPTSFLYFVYTPIFHLLSALSMKIFGLSILIPRLISLISLVTIIYILWSIFQDTRTNLIKRLDNVSITAVLIGLTVSIVFYAKYYVLARADLLAYAFAFGSVFYCWQLTNSPNPSTRNFILAGLLALLAIYTKQSVFFPYLLIAVLLLLNKNRRQWLMFGFSLAVSTVIGFIILQLITNGGFWSSMHLASEVYGKYLNSTAHLMRLQSIFVHQHWPLLLSLPLLLLLSVKTAVNKNFRLPFSLITSATIYVNFLVTGGNQGADHNTLIPLVLGVLFNLKELYQFDSSKNYLGSTLVIMLCFMQLTNLRTLREPYLKPTPEDFSAQESLLKAISLSPGQLILGDRVDYAIIKSGKTSVLETSTHGPTKDWPITKPYADKVESELLNRLKSSEINQVIVGSTRFNQGILWDYTLAQGQLSDIIKINYLDARDVEHYIYKIK